MPAGQSVICPAGQAATIAALDDSLARLLHDARASPFSMAFCMTARTEILLGMQCVSPHAGVQSAGWLQRLKIHTMLRRVNRAGMRAVRQVRI